jgi:hypothetical protein
VVGCGYGWGEVLVAVDASILGVGEEIEEMVGVVVVVARRHPPTNITSNNINPVMMIEVYLLCMTQPH